MDARRLCCCGDGGGGQDTCPWSYCGYLAQWGKCNPDYAGPGTPFVIEAAPTPTYARAFEIEITDRQSLRRRFDSKFVLDYEREWTVRFGVVPIWSLDGSGPTQAQFDAVALAAGAADLDLYLSSQAILAPEGPGPGDCVSRVWGIPFFGWAYRPIVGSTIQRSPTAIRTPGTTLVGPFSLFPSYWTGHRECGEVEITTFNGTPRGTQTYTLDAGPDGGTATLDEDLDPIWLDSKRRTTTIGVNPIAGLDLGPLWDGPAIDLCPGKPTGGGMTDIGDPQIGGAGPGQITGGDDSNAAAILAAMGADPLRGCRSCGDPGYAP